MKGATREWVRKAENDFRGARGLARKEPPLHDLVCFHCQQCAEKYLKALLEELGIPIAKTHELEKLLTALQPHRRALTPLKRGLSFLTRFAVEIRYPGENAGRRQAEAALRWADRVRTAVRPILGLPLRP